jgi:mannose-6-phosphate isomerase-like protein (cupin superfamily)
MLKAGDTLENPVMGQRVVFCRTARDTGGAFLQVEYFNQPFTGKGSVPAHFHPTMTECFEILTGTARYRLDKDEREAKRGDVLTFPPRVPHLHPWSVSAEQLHVRQTTTPDQPNVAALEVSQAAVVTLFDLARDGKVNQHGVPNLLQLAVLVRSMMPYAYVDGMPIAVQEAVFGALAAIGRLAGYRATYRS